MVPCYPADQGTNALGKYVYMEDKWEEMGLNLQDSFA